MPDPFLIFLDANVLAKPVTRTLLLAGAEKSGYRPVWSETAVIQADRHLGSGRTPVSDLSVRFGWLTTPAGAGADRFSATTPEDRQILADAHTAGALFLITENVDDFATVNLVECGLSAVTADLFMAARFSATAYQEALTVLTAHRVRPPDTPAEMHRALGRQHPRLASRYAHVFRSQLQAPAHPEPKFLFRGDRCLYCGQRQDSPPGLESGRCDSC